MTDQQAEQAVGTLCKICEKEWDFWSKHEARDVRQAELERIKRSVAADEHEAMMQRMEATAELMRQRRRSRHPGRA